MSAPGPDDVRRALIDRLEADARFGLGFLPVRRPAVSAAQSPIHPRAATPLNSRPATRGDSTRAVPAYRSHDTTAAAIGPTSAHAAPVRTRQSVDDGEVERRRIRLRTIDDNEVMPCTKCALNLTRTKTVFGVGTPAARIVFVGEAPGHDEDVSGEPFVGRAGQLLTDMIQKGMGLRREDVYICNVLKCRPPNNRAPAADEVAACRDYLARQISIIAPEVIIALGAPAAQTLLDTREGIGKLRSRFHGYHVSGTPLIGEPIPLMPTFHPAYLLRSPGEKLKAWADLKLVMQRLGLPLPRRR